MIAGAAAGLFAVFAAGGAAGVESRFERTACPVETAPGERIECGVLLAPENRRAANSRTIRMPVMIFRSRSATPAKDPVLFLPGGPGLSSVAGQRSGARNPFLEHRDHIHLEPRGARFAQPRLACPEYNAAQHEIASGRVVGAGKARSLVAAATACRARLMAAGADLSGYTSAETADDIEDLRRALGYERLNLYGVSYGTRLALTVLRRHPGSVRSLILDSVLPPEVEFDETASANIRRSLNLVFDRCASDPACSRAHPNLARRFAELVARADRRPLPAKVLDAAERPVVVRGAQVVSAVYNSLHGVRTIPGVPKLIGDAAAGSYDDLRASLEGGEPSNFDWGLRLSIWCAEEAPFEDAARVAAQIAPEQGLGGADERTAAPEVCRAWNVPPAPAVENTPVASDAPVVIFAGEYDPDTPPDWGRRQLRTLPNARFVELAGHSHGASFNACAGGIALAFLKDPTAPLPLECAARMPGPDFGLGVP